MIVFSESDPDSERDADLAGLTRAALDEGLEVVRVEAEAAAEPGAPLTGALTARQGERAVRFGTILSPEHYRAFHAQARALGVELLNTPEQHLDALEFDRIVGALGALTPLTEVVTAPEQCAAAVGRLGLPLFVKGSTASRKWYGWKSCVAETAAEVEALTKKLLALSHGTRGKVLLRRLAPLRRSGATYEGFPISREYRLFALNGEVLASGYYWPFGDTFGALTPADTAEHERLVAETARRCRVPWLAVDLGQLDDGRWIVIETGDPQCSGLSQIVPRALVKALKARVG